MTEKQRARLAHLEDVLRRELRTALSLAAAGADDLVFCATAVAPPALRARPSPTADDLWAQAEAVHGLRRVLGEDVEDGPGALFLAACRRWADVADAHRPTAQRLARELLQRLDVPLPSEAGDVLRLLFVCSRNRWRSPTAEAVWGRRAGVEARSAGTASSARRRLTEADLRWADLVLVMEHRHRQRIRQDFPEAAGTARIEVLGIPDAYGFMDPELVAIVEEAVASWVEEARGR